MTIKHFLGAFLFSGAVLAQNKQLLYDFTEIPQSLMQNPGASTNFRLHVGMPLLSGVYVNAGSSGFSIYDIFADDGVSINTKIRNLIFTASSNDVMALNQQLELFNIGFKPKGWYSKDYYSLGMYQEIDAYSYWPRDLAVLAYEGNATNLGVPFNLGHITAKGELLTVFHFGVNRKVNDKFTAGIRGKIYSGIIDFTSTSNSGFFRTTQGDRNIYNHILDANLMLQTSGYASLREIESEDTSDGARQVLRQFRKRAFFGGDLGLGLDLGFTYSPNERVTYTGSILDIGFIHHSNDVETYTLNERYEWDGLEFVFPELINDNGTNDYWQDFENELEGLVDTVNTSYTTWRPVKLNASVKYAFGRPTSRECNCRAQEQEFQNQIGAQLFAMSTPRQPRVALTAFYYRRLFDFLRLKATYTVDKFSKSNVGLGASAHLGNVNFYILADNLLEYQNLADANILSIQFGFNFIIKDSDKPY